MDSDPGLNLLAFQVVIQADTGNLPLLITMFLTLLACSGLISASEVGFFSLGLNEVKELEDENSSLTNRILSLKERPRHLLATILIANNFVNSKFKMFLIIHNISRSKFLLHKFYYPVLR